MASFIVEPVRESLTQTRLHSSVSPTYSIVFGYPRTMLVRQSPFIITRAPGALSSTNTELMSCHWVPSDSW